MAPRCGTCDICLGWGRTQGRPLDDEELLRVRIALSGVGRLSGRFGVERIAQMLTGSRAREVLDRELDRVPTYGKLASAPINEVKDLLGLLADAGLLERQGIEGGRPGAFVLTLTSEGRRVALGETRPELALPAVAPRTPRKSARTADRTTAEPPADHVDTETLARLKRWRTDEARRQGVPPYFVFHDRTLVEVAAARPQALEELRRVPGIGPAKLERYGQALLALVSAA